MTVESNHCQVAAEEVARALWDVRPPDEGELEQASLELYRKANGLRREQRFDDAIICCETARRLARQTRDSSGTAAFRYTEGFGLALLGAIYLHRCKVHPAIECFQQAAARFRDCNRHRSESVAWMAIGEGYVLLIGEKEKKGDVPLQDWEHALSTIQRCLNIIEGLRATDQVTIRLKEQIDKKLGQVHRNFTESLGGSTTPPTVATTTNVRGQAYYVPVVESIAAGAGRIVEDDIRSYILLSREMVRDAKFAVQVEGQSMKADGILNGDYVIIREQPTADRGATVAVLILTAEGLTLGTLKHYYPEDDHHRLEPANEDEPTLIVVPVREDVRRVEASYHQHGKNILTYVGDCQIVGIPAAIFREIA